MFIEKIRRLASEYNVPFSDMTDIAKQSLRYGMRLTRTPGMLKKELKKLRIDSTRATPMWKGNAYLLITIPKVLCDRKAKIPCLEDLMFIKSCLQAEDFEEIQKRVSRMPEHSVEDLMGLLKKNIKNQAHSGKFLPYFDRMFENQQDVVRDIYAEALSIVNKEYTNFNSTKAEDMEKYLGYCLQKKSKTYIKRSAPKMTRVYTNEDDTLDHLIERNGESLMSESDIVFRKDLQKMLPPLTTKAVLLFLDLAPEKDERDFDSFLRSRGKVKSRLTQKLLQKYIERHTGVDVVETLRANQELINYLRS